MTFKELKQLVDSQSHRQDPKLDQLMQRLRGKPFWIWDPTTHRERDRTQGGNCCFNHIIGLPKKNGIDKPMFDYEWHLYRALLEEGYLNSRSHNVLQHPFKEKHLWVKKATGLGVTEFMLRFMVWLCLRNDDCQGSQMVIVTGPNQDLAINLIKRMKGLFSQESHGITFDSKETVLELNGCSIQAYPSNHIDAFRSLTNPKFILIDEGDFFPKFQQDDVRHVAERYIAKSDPFIILVSTPNAPGGLFDRIEKEPFESCIYKKLFLDYTYGLDKIYTKEEIEKARVSPSFPREYQLQYLGIEGNVFSQASIELCQKVRYNPRVIVQSAPKSMGIDPAYGSSNFAIVVTQLVDGKIQVIEASEWERPDFNVMVSKVWELKNKCGHVSNVYVDASNPSFIQALKREFNEPFDEQYIRDKQAYCRKYNLHIEDQMFCIPTPFSIEGKKMLSHAKWLLDEKEEEEDGVSSSLVAIDKRFDKLLVALRTATMQEWKLQKEETSYNDILDAFLLSLQYYKRSK